MSLDEKIKLSFLQEIRNRISKIPKSLSALVFAGAVALGNYSCGSSACEADNECKEVQICVRGKCVYPIYPVYPLCLDKDGDGYGNYCNLSKDCDDNDDKVHEILSCNYNGHLCGDFQLCIAECPLPPEESCDGEDDDCDGETDEEVLLTFYKDNDRDGFGDINNLGFGCQIPPGYVGNNSDCNDNNRVINPYITERCDNLDNDCDGETDDNLTRTCYSICGNGLETCISGMWRDCTAGVINDCIDYSSCRTYQSCDPCPSIPLEECDGRDNDCDESTDDACGRIAFVSDREGNWEIYVMNANGTSQRNLTNNPADDWEPTWSTDGTRIAFTSAREGNREIYVMNAEGSEQRNLTNDSAYDNHPSWSPDGRRIAFDSDRDRNNEIYVMNADGTNPRRLTNNSAYNAEPAWSPDGQQIAFYSSRDGNAEIYVMNADRTSQRNLTNNPTDSWEPTWSPNGTEIAFSSYRDGNAEIYVMNADGTNQRRLTNNSANDSFPAWSPDGTQIAFTSYRDENWEIYVMNADGTNQRNLTNDSAWDMGPDWTP